MRTKILSARQFFNSTKYALLLIVLSTFLLPVTAQTYQFYRGNLHAHTGYSDGNAASDANHLTPFQCYQYADSSQQFDFLGISEHNHNGAGMVLANYAQGCTQAQNATNANFVALYGMEWGTISGGGHVIIYGVDSLMGWENNNYHIYTTYGDYNNLFSKIAARNSAFAYLAHPEATDYNNFFTSPYSSLNDQAIIGSAVRSGPAFSTNTTYTNPSTFSYYQRYKDLLALGYHAGPLIDHDNHYITFGRTTQARTVVLAPSLTKANLFDALKNNRFYASEDWNVEVNFTVNSTTYMGQTVESTLNPTFQITVTDPNAGDNISYIRIRYALQNGGNTAPGILVSSTGNTLSYTHTLAAEDAYYYFLEIQQADGNMIYTAPIWYKKVSALPVTLTNFEAAWEQKAGQMAISWTTESENRSDYFTLERSTDGENWEMMSRIEALGTSTEEFTYHYADQQAKMGLNYYRLTEVDEDGSVMQQRVTSASRQGTKHFDVFPNPSYTVFYITNPAYESFEKYAVYDQTGKLVTSGAMQAELQEVDVSSWKRGTYYLYLFRGRLKESTTIVVE